MALDFLHSEALLLLKSFVKTSGVEGYRRSLVYRVEVDGFTDCVTGIDGFWHFLVEHVSQHVASG